MDRVRVLVPLALDEPYDYLVPEALTPAIGDVVVVPLGPRQVTGVVWEAGGSDVPERKLKPIIARHDVPPLPRVLIKFVDWVAQYTLAPKGSVLRLVLRVPAALEPSPPRIAYRLGGPPPERMTSARSRVLEVVSDGLMRSPAALREEAGVSAAVVRGLLDSGTLETVALPGDEPFPAPDASREGVVLSGEQAFAADRLRERVVQGGYSAVLLDGVTGSGKTEVYFEAVAAAIRGGRQALILLPEIALTAQFLERFERRFGCRPLEWHSDLSQKERRRAWRATSRGDAQVVVGARSALFLPFPDLGLIIVDEEHEGAYKQEDGVIYNARDMAVVRAHLGGFPIVLASATPSLETVVNVEQLRYDRLQLPRRHGSAGLPSIDLVDMRSSGPERGRWLSPLLVDAMAETYAASEQSMLFLNRRGYAPVTICRSCGERMDCPTCDAALVEHRFRNRLICHHCGFSMLPPRYCPHCGAEENLVPCGPGVERIAEEVAQNLPQARIEIMSSDNLHGPSAHQRVVSFVERGEVDIIVGTQMVAKGHHFPLLTLVGVIDADLGLESADLRAAERTYQLLHQVAGRCGRAGRPGRVLLQSYQPEHPVIRSLVAGDRDAFLAEEANKRERAGLPPFGRLVGVVLSGPEPATIEEVGRVLSAAAPQAEGFRVLGPAPAPITKIRGRYRSRLLVKASRKTNVQAYMTSWLRAVKLPAAVRVTVDVDPYSFL